MARSFRFTKKLIEALPPNPSDARAREAEYSDTEVTGLKILVNKAGKKMFYFRYTHQGQKRGIKVGNYPAIDISEARQIALEHRAGLNRGINPQRPQANSNACPYLCDFVRIDYLPHAKCSGQLILATSL